MEELIRINKVIAEFMGYEIIPYNGTTSLIYNTNKYAKTVGQQKDLWGGLDLQFTGRFVDRVVYPFNTDFNYLIPVIQRIEEMGYVVAIKRISYEIYGVLDEENVIVGFVCGDLSKKTQMVCDLIVTFIERHLAKNGKGR